MKSILDPSSSVIILFVSMALLMFSINTPTCLCDDHDFGQYYTNCNAGFSCEGSSISDHLKYPFWGENRHSYCGSVSGSSYSHDMELTCESHVPKITLNEVKYRVLNWDNTTQMLRVAREDYWGGNVCAVTDYYKNSTFDNTPFQLVGDDHNGYMNLLYNCDAKGNLSTDQFDHMTCRDVYGSGNYTTVVYTVEDPSSVPCSPSAIVVIPIIKQPPALVPQSRLADALEGGFELRYTGRHFAECGRCVASGGACGNGFKFGTDDFTCFFCKDDGRPYTTHNTTKCNSQSSKWIRKRELWLIMTGVLFVGFGVAIFIIVIVMKRGICGKKRIFWVQGKLFDHDVKAFMQSYDLFMVKRYNYAELKKITNSFRDKVGQGGYGVVYKGCLPDGRRVAAKVISESKGSGEDFINEVASIGRTSHMNIVSLLGFCYEVNKRALIFEFMPNGSLDKFIYRSGFPNAICDFDWNTLFQIAIGIARGLEYLHQGCIARILHLDIKPQNILLDEDFCPKISDFGLAKICQKKESIVSIPGTRGTIGYMAPEVFSRAFGGVSHKSDVYSYGMLILEMIGGRNNHDTGGSHPTEMYFPNWIYKDLEQGKTPANCLAISEEENEIVRKISMVSLWCIQTNPLDRPSMKKVIDLLEGPLQSVPHPPKPILYSPELSPLQISSMSSNSLYEANSITT